MSSTEHAGQRVARPTKSATRLKTARPTTREARRHKCPSRCHYCPDMVEIAKENGTDPRDPLNYTMPWCMGGATFGRPGCHCPPNGEAQERVDRQTRELAQLDKLIAKYPDAALRMLTRRVGSDHALTDELAAVRSRRLGAEDTKC